MNVLLFVPRAKFNYKAPWTPLGTLSIATFLKQHGHSVRLIDRSFDRKKVQKHFDAFCPDVICVSVVSARVFDDAVCISAAARENGTPVVWGGFFATEYCRECLIAGYADYITLGEGEYTTLHLLHALEDGTPLREVRGIAYLQDGQLVKTEQQPLADLRDLPVLDFSLCDPEQYLHPYLFCKRMIYLYASKGCPSDCTFCSNPRFHCHKYRARPIEYVIREIKYLYEHYQIDGVYFSDECWYLRRDLMQEFCRRLREENIQIHWGCELRFGIYDEEDLRTMYEAGCRWIFYGVESGDPEMLIKVKKNITVDRVRSEVAICNRLGIVAITSFIIGYPDERPEQLCNTIRLIQEIEPGVSVCNIFTPIPNSEIYDALIQSGQYVPSATLRQDQITMPGEYSTYRCNTIPMLDLRVIRSRFMWNGFTKKSVTDESKKFEVAVNAIKETIRHLRRQPLHELAAGVWLAAKEFFPIFWYAHFYPSIRKKYDLR